MQLKHNRRKFIIGLGALTVLNVVYFFKHQKKILMDQVPDLVKKIPAEHWVPIRAMTPVILAGVYSGNQDWEDFFSSLQLTLEKLTPSDQAELAQLLNYLNNPILRRGFFQLSDDWLDAKPEAIESMLYQWSKSRWLKKRAAYQALLALTYSAWYAQPKNWAGIGYDGPPSWN